MSRSWRERLRRVLIPRSLSPLDQKELDVLLRHLHLSSQLSLVRFLLSQSVSEEEWAKKGLRGTRKIPSQSLLSIERRGRHP